MVISAGIEVAALPDPGIVDGAAPFTIVRLPAKPQQRLKTLRL